MQEQIFDILLKRDEVTWQAMLMELVRDMDPWDVDVSLLTRRYIEMLKKFKELDFKVSGKVVLAAALLLKVKSSRLIGEDIAEMDRLMSQQDVDEDAFYDDLKDDVNAHQDDLPVDSLMPRTPQPRKRKVSVYDLVNSLQKALDVKDRRVLRNVRVLHIEPPYRHMDMSRMIGGIYKRIVALFKISQPLTFTRLVSSEDRKGKIMAFIPLLHLANHDQRKVDLKQDEPFGEIEIIPKQ